MTRVIGGQIEFCPDLLFEFAAGREDDIVVPKIDCSIAEAACIRAAHQPSWPETR
jgi:hypothetical protein